MKRLLSTLISVPCLWVLARLERLTVWIHAQEELDPYETGKLAWEIRRLREQITKDTTPPNP